MATIKILDFTFDVDFESNTASIKKFEGKDSVLYLPNTLTLKNPQGNVVEVKVTEIGETAFTQNSYLKKLIIRKNNYYKTIGKRAFYECSSLEEFIHNNGLFDCSYGDEAFSKCVELKTPSLPNMLSHIGWGCFSYCSNLREVYIPGNVAKLDGEAFSKCSNLESIIFEESDGTLEIQASAFYDCYNLKSFKMPSQLELLGRGVFNNCEGMTKVEFNSKITEIPILAFSNCISLNDVQIPINVTKINNLAFNNCSSMNSLIFEEKTIDGKTVPRTEGEELILSTTDSINNTHSIFNGCNIKYLIIPEKVIIWDEYIFSGCHINKLTLKQEPNDYFRFRDCHILDIDFQFQFELGEYIGNFYSYTDSNICTTITLRFTKDIRKISLLPDIHNLYIDTNELDNENILEFTEDGMYYTFSNNKQVDIYITSLSGWNYVKSHKRIEYSQENVFTNPLAAGGRLYYLKNEKYELFQDLNLEFKDTDEQFNPNTLPYCGYKHLKTVKLSGYIPLPFYYFNDCSNLETVAIKKLGDGNVELPSSVFSDTNIKTVFYGDSGDDWMDYFYMADGRYGTNRNNGNLPCGKNSNGKIDLFIPDGVTFTTYCFPQLTLFSQPIINLTPATNYQMILENKQGILSFHKFKTQLVPIYANNKGSYKKGLVWIKNDAGEYVQGIPWMRQEDNSYEVIESFG